MISLDNCVKHFPENSGIHISRLAQFQGVRIQTQNNPYSLFVLEPSEGKVLVRGGRFFPDFREAYLCGSSWGGSILRLGWIGLGMCLEIYVDGMRIVTTPLKAYAVEEPPAPRVC